MTTIKILRPFLLFGLAAGLPVAARSAPADVAEPRSIVVRFRGEVPRTFDLEPSIASVARRPRTRGLAVLSLQSDARLSDGLAAARRLPGVVAASPNYRTEAAAIGDPYRAHQWNLGVIGWEAARPFIPPSPSTVVALLDTGVAYRDLTDPRDPLPDRTTDLYRVRFVAGWDFVDDDSDPRDENQHGTLLASVIGAAVDDAQGIAGYVDTIGLQPVRVLDEAGLGTLAELIEGIDFAVDSNADVINLSLTIAGSTDLAVLEDSLRRAVDRGAVLVGASGNSNSAVAWPAAYPPVIAVGAVRWNGCASNTAAAVKSAIYSNWGPLLDVMAPGGDNSMDVDHDGYPDGILGATFDPARPWEYGLWFSAGTSVAAAQVSAVAAVLRCLGVPAASVGPLLSATATDLGAGGFDAQTGAGLVDAGSAVGRAASGNVPAARRFDVAVTTAPSANRTRADLFVTDRDLALPAAGVTVYGRWDIGRGVWDSGVSDAEGRLTLMSPPRNGEASFEVEAAVVGGAGFIGSITPGARVERSLETVAYTSVTPGGHEPGCGGRE